MSWTKDDVRDEMDEQEDEEEEILWIDKKGKIVEGAFCAWFLQKHPLMCLDQKLFDLDGEVNEERLRHEIHQEIRPAARNDTAKKTKRIVDAGPTTWTSGALCLKRNFASIASRWSTSRMPRHRKPGWAF